KESSRLIIRQQESYNHLIHRLQQNHPKDKLLKAQQVQLTAEKRLTKEFQQQLRHHTQVFGAVVSKLQALSPLKIMERGYSLVYDEDDRLLKSINSVEHGETLKVKLQDGQIDCKVTGIEE